MTLSPDEVAGVVDLFGELSPTELARAREELGYRLGEAIPETDVRAAVRAYTLVPYERDGERRIAVGPTAFPVIPDGGEDLPHILDIEPRTPERDALVAAALDRFREASLLALRIERAGACERLVDVSYDIEAWADVSLGAIRERLDAATR
ncbi:DUF7109 family protein [Halosegnis longus]|uniref:Uncharacterized protein n=1 Tax=Halosegnis longus TaxID=2216012 RepID=A0AAJ4UWE3_9EURY|nr:MULTISPECIES: hypothetical protein [Halobacteriales]RNJ26976.1 hypothetical protein Nmn1133_09965 [Salella cibi]